MSRRCVGDAAGVEATWSVLSCGPLESPGPPQTTELACSDPVLLGGTRTPGLHGVVQRRSNKAKSARRPVPTQREWGSRHGRRSLQGQKQGTRAALQRSGRGRRAGSVSSCPGERLAGPRTVRHVTTRASSSAPGMRPRGIKTPTTWKPARRCFRRRPKVAAPPVVVRGQVTKPKRRVHPVEYHSALKRDGARPRTERRAEEARHTGARGTPPRYGQVNL